MTPKEKAIHIIEQHQQWTVTKEDAIACSYITILEIIDGFKGVEITYTWGNYWNKVKSEIIKIMETEKTNNSKSLSKTLNVPHKDIMKFYWYLENAICKRRHLIKCTLTIEEDGSESWLREMSDSLILVIMIKFGKQNMLGVSDF